MTTDLQATLTAIDDLAVDQCGHCDQPLRPDGPSPDFCNDWCQQAWISRRDEVRELTGYREPVDLPQHVGNLVEASSPETTAASPVQAALAELARNYRPRWSDDVLFWIPSSDAYEEATRTALEGMREQLARMGEQLAAGFVRAGEAMAGIGLHLPPREPDERPPMLRAIEARRARNTGPAQPCHAPRRIDPRRTR